MLLRNQHFVAEPFGPHLDAAIVPAGKRGRADITEIIEAKSTALVDEWGEELTDQVPDRVLVQTHVQMYATGEQCRTAWVAVMLPGYRSLDRKKYRINRDDKLMKAIVEAGEEFWHCVESDTQPPGSYATLDVLERRRREPKLLVEFGKDDSLDDIAAKLYSESIDESAAKEPYFESLTGEDKLRFRSEAALHLIAKWEVAKSHEATGKKDANALRARILTLLGDAEGRPCQTAGCSRFSSRTVPRRLTTTDSKWRTRKSITAL